MTKIYLCKRASHPSLFLLLFVNAAFCQLSTGTVVTINFSDDKLSVAADSRGVHHDPARLPDDTQCKVSVLDRKVVFASAGAMGYTPVTAIDVGGWNNRLAASDALAKAGTSDIKIDQVTAYWAQDIVTHWRSLYAMHPELVREAATQGVGVLTTGFFATAVHDRIERRFVLVTLDPMRIPGISAEEAPNLESCWSCGQPEGYTLCGMGNYTIPSAICSERSSNASRMWREAKWRSVKERNYVTETAIALAETAAYCDLTGYIAPPIDAVELAKDGGISWIQRKDVCQESQSVGDRDQPIK